MLTDTGGLDIRRLAYAAFGEEAANSGAGVAPTYTYTDKERDRSGLLYYGARYYDPALARFITADSVYDAGPQGLNRYSYALNNPILYRDPTGYAVKTPQYMAETSYELLPSITRTFDTGSDLADAALATLSGVFNLGAVAVNAPFNAYGAVEEGYNALTEAVIGQKGFSREGFTQDLFLLEGFGLPLGSILKQVRMSSAYTNTYLRANASRLQNWYKASSLADETGSMYLGGKASKETVTYFRVQGGGSKHLIYVDDVGNVKIKNGTLNISTGTSEHADYFLNKRPGGEITSFEVPKWMDDFIKESAIPQENYKTNPLNQGGLAPKIVDPTTPGTSYELPSIWSKWLEEVAVPNSGKVGN